VETLTGRISVPPDAQVAAGQTSSFCTIIGGQLFAWGKLKPSGECARVCACVGCGGWVGVGGVGGVGWGVGAASAPLRGAGVGKGEG
jgi:hypothetical protein